MELYKNKDGETESQLNDNVVFNTTECVIVIVLSKTRHLLWVQY